MYCLLNLHSAYVKYKVPYKVAAIKIYSSIPDQPWSSIYEELKFFQNQWKSDGGCQSDQVQYTNFKAQ